MSYRDNNSGGRGGGGGGGRRGSSRGGRRPSNFHSLPVEQGIICTLKDAFGFIHCADRPEEIFFHYSEVANCHPDDLQIDTEVEFKVGGDDKLAAYEVHALPSGTVQWEVEDEPNKIYKGKVEKAPRSSSGRDKGFRRSSSELSTNSKGGGGYEMDGSIQVLVDDSDGDGNQGNDDGDVDDTDGAAEDDNKKKKSSKSGPVVRLRVGEYKGEVSESSTMVLPSGGTPKYLDKGDIIEFRILIDRRTKQKYARYVKLVHSEKERKRLENATAEEGIITSLKNGFGFIKSNRRRDDVYFHYSNVVLPEPGNVAAVDNDNGNENGKSSNAEGGDAHEEFELKIGQEVKFLVVSEGSSGMGGGGSGNQKASARQIEMLPKGAVHFHTVEATGVKGIVVTCPHPPTPGSGDDSQEGKVQLLEPLIKNQNEGDEKQQQSGDLVNDVFLHYSDAPGGVFTYQNHRNQNVNALWIQDGDTLLFDVIEETIDGTYRAIPTLHTLGLGGVVQAPTQADDVEDDSQRKDMKRVMRMVRPSLVGRSEGTVHTLKNDYGFFHFAERPIDVHFKMYDLLPDEMQDDVRTVMGIEGPVNLELGTSVQFDICAHGNITSHGGSRNHRHGRGGRGGDSHPHERENIRGQRVVVLPKPAVHTEKLLASDARGVIKSTDTKQFSAGFVDIEQHLEPMSLDERHPLVRDMLDSFLEESSRSNGRKTLVFRDTLGVKDDDVVIEMANLKAGNCLECSHIPIPGISGRGRLCLRRLDKDASPSEPPKSDEGPSEDQNGPPKTKKKEQDISKNARFDKSCLSDDAKNDIPPAKGDIISCDVYQSRRTMKVLLRNIKVVERKEVDPNDTDAMTTEASGMGIVKDVLPKRNFGFISVLDDNAARREILFFHLPQGGGFRKGAEVKFDIAMEGAKRVATNVQLLPNGTVPSTVAKNACLGIVLMEPTHTSLANTPLRKAQSNMSSGSQSSVNSRWAEKKEDGKTSEVDLHEEGCILLLEDKSGMFQKKERGRRRKAKKHPSESGSDDMSTGSGVSTDDGLSDDDMSGDESATSDENTSANAPVTILSHLAYKNGSIAIHGTGASSAMDGSGNPKRGDLVTFVRGRKRNTVRDIRIQSRQNATLQRGRLEDIQPIDTESGKNKGRAKFIAATDQEEVYEIDLSEIVSCNVNKLKEKESVEGILHDGQIYGVCRTCDLYLSSKIGTGHKTRPKLNLTVKKDRGGKIIAQSMMAKGPDGTTGFAAGWTNRTSEYAAVDEGEEVANSSD
mmetsp:Transcript_7669/g.18954  ORF Transcript_7669/g.18954 Transcript_7669/m.18954 type:complete len:1259 (+) Transcript_7669:189-3965(+)